MNKDLIDVSGLGIKAGDFGKSITLTVTGGNMTVDFNARRLYRHDLPEGQNKIGAAGVDATDFRWAP